MHRLLRPATVGFTTISATTGLRGKIPGSGLGCVGSRMIRSVSREKDEGGVEGIRLAVLHQAIEPPVIAGVRKEMKPGGYKDSSADIAYVLHHNRRQHNEITIVTPSTNPDPSNDADWSFPDTESGLLSAIKEHKATHLWANTILFSNHPLQSSKELDSLAGDIYMIGQPPQLVEKYDDKNWVNAMLRKDNNLRLPRSWTISLKDTPEPNLKTHLQSLDLPYPVIGKPIRGRGSHGVKLCGDLTALTSHISSILSESPQIMIEEFLAGQEGTVTVMPPIPGTAAQRYWSLPVVERFNHADGVAPYNGIVAVVANSRVVPLHEQAYSVMGSDGSTVADVDANMAADPDNAYVDVMRQCEVVAERLRCTAPIRVDVRRRKAGTHGSTSENPFVLFDVNMKPNMTGPGRPGREDQASLTALAAAALGWDYPRLLREMLKTARPLSAVRAAALPDEWL